MSFLCDVDGHIFPRAQARFNLGGIMSSYTVRVELKGSPSYEPYEALHAQMAGSGFFRYIDGVHVENDQAARFSLPTGLYFGESIKSAADVKNQSLGPRKSDPVCCCRICGGDS
jgi:hypothetical protein